MGEIEIIALKPEYQRMVRNNEQKYNPDMNSILDESEIGVLKSEAGVESVDDLLASRPDTLIGSGPCVHITVNDTARFEGTGNTVGFGVGNNGSGVGYGVTGMNGNIITKKEIDFYTGMEYRDVTDEKFKPLFRELDLNNDGKLSAEEIEKYQQYRDQKIKYEGIKKRAGRGMFWGGLGTLITGGIINFLGNASTKANPVGITFVLAGLGLCAAGIIKNAKKADLSKFPEVEQGDQRYRTIGY